MKKILWGISAGVVALGMAAMPATAGYPQVLERDIYDLLVLDGNFDTFVELIDVAGYDELFDVPSNDVLGDLCANGDAQYTVFAPFDGDGAWRSALEDLLDKSWAQILATPGLAKAIVDDHVVNNSVSIAEMQNPTLQQLVARSGFLIAITSPTGFPRDILGGYPGNVSAAGRTIWTAAQACNGHIYAIPQPFSSTKKVTTEGLGPEDSPKDGTPGGTNSLPNTL